MNIDYNITVCVEYDDLYCLLTYLNKLKQNDDVIHVIIDSAQPDRKLTEAITAMVWKLGGIPRLYPFDTFEKNYTYAQSFWHNDLVFGICPDELPSPFLMFNLRKPFEQDPELDMMAIPRMNIFTDLTPEKSEVMYVGDRPKNFLLQEPINEYGWHAWPDYQCRLQRNLPEIRYGTNTHQGIIGYKKVGYFPADPAFALLHSKTVEHQERMLKVYDQIGKG